MRTRIAAAALIGAALSGACSTGEQSIPRERTLILDRAEVNTCSGQIQDYNSFNPYLPGGVSRIGYNFLYEPLYFFNAYGERDEVIPWSDGTPWTAHDLVFTIHMLKDNAPELTFSTDMETWVDTAVAVDDHTARIQLKAPNPRFIFSYFTHNFDNGVPIVPRHVWQGRDPVTFANFDMERGWPVVSGPYRLALSMPEQRVWELRPEWWAQRIGFRALPKVERLIYLPYMDEPLRVQNLIANNMDVSLDMRPPNIQTTVEGNPRVTTWSGRQPPYGYLDWWPISLGFNVLEEPFNRPEVRWAINYAIDRQQLLEVGWQGAGSTTVLPFPDFAPLRRFTGQIDDLLERYPVGTYDPARTDRIMDSLGWQRDDEGFWSREGERFKIVVDIFPIFQDIAPILTAQTPALMGGKIFVAPVSRPPSARRPTPSRA